MSSHELRLAAQFLKLMMNSCYFFYYLDNSSPLLVIVPEDIHAAIHKIVTIAG